MAPGLGLYLDELFFEGYNSKQDAEWKMLENKNAKAKVAAAAGKPEGEAIVSTECTCFCFLLYIWWRCLFLCYYLPSISVLACLRVSLSHSLFRCVCLSLSTSISSLSKSHTNKCTVRVLEKYCGGMKMSQLRRAWMASGKELSGLIYLKR